MYGSFQDYNACVYEKFMDLTSNPMDFLDAKPFRKRTHYNPENYRTSIADPMMIINNITPNRSIYKTK